MRYVLLPVIMLTCGLAAPAFAQSTYVSDVPLGIDWIIVPDDNPMSAEKVALGKQLFFDVRLSGNQTVSCATCHDPNKGWADDRRFTPGAHGEPTTRNVPSNRECGTPSHVVLGRPGCFAGRASLVAAREPD